jgi:hypothetical protein
MGSVKRDFQGLFVFVPNVGDFIFVSIDTKMIQESTDAVVVHGTHLVYVAVLSESLWHEAPLLSQHELGVHPVLLGESSYKCCIPG